MDPRIELISVVEALGARNPCSRGEESGYLAEVRRAFDSKHPACRLFGEMTLQDWRHRHPSLIVLDFDAPPALAVSAHHDHYANQGKDDALARFLPALRDFAARSGFMDFFSGHKAFYETLTRPTRLGFEKTDYLPPITDYLGMSREHRYHFVMVPLYHGSAHHNVLYKRDDGSYDIYSINGHRGVKQGLPDYRLDVVELSHTAWHEIAHTMIDAITQEHKAALLPLSPLYGLMTGLAKEKYRGPLGWLHMVDEHVIRAITSRVSALTGGEAQGLSMLNMEKRDGFSLVGPVYETLLEYEKDRERYPTIRDFYPRLVETFTRLYAQVGRKAGWKRP